MGKQRQCHTITTDHSMDDQRKMVYAQSCDRDRRFGYAFIVPCSDLNCYSIHCSVKPRSLALSPTRFQQRVTSQSDCLIGCYLSLVYCVVLWILNVWMQPCMAQVTCSFADLMVYGWLGVRHCAHWYNINARQSHSRKHHVARSMKPEIIIRNNMWAYVSLII